MTAAPQHVIFGTGAIGLATLSGCHTLHIRHYGPHRQSDFVLQRPTS
jgi:hypothetical protein